MFNKNEILVAKSFNKYIIFKFSESKEIHGGSDLVNVNGFTVTVPVDDYEFALIGENIIISNDKRDNFIDSYFIKKATEKQIEMFNDSKEIFGKWFS